MKHPINSVYMIGSEIESQINAVYALEMRFVKQVRPESTYYEIYALKKVESDTSHLNEFELVDTGNIKNLKKILEARLNWSGQSFPSEIRVIKTNPEQQQWSVFFKK